MELKIINAEGQVSGSLSASDALFAREYNEALVHQLVTAYLANARSGNRAQKTRAEVKHSTKTPWRQKGTGRARSGMTSSPLWRKGGRAFPNKPTENFTQKINRKMYRAGMAVILSQLVRDERLLVVEELSVETPKTKEFFGKVKKMGLDGDVLFLTRELDEKVYLSSRKLAALPGDSSRSDTFDNFTCLGELVPHLKVCKFIRQSADVSFLFIDIQSQLLGLFIYALECFLQVIKIMMDNIDIIHVSSGPAMTSHDSNIVIYGSWKEYADALGYLIAYIDTLSHEFLSSP